MIKFKIKHPDISNNEKSYLLSSQYAGFSELTLKSVQGFSTGKYIVAGNTGSERTEIALISNITDNTLTVGTLTGDHPIDDPVTVIDYNKVKIYECATAGGSYVLVDTVDIDVEQDYTVYDYLAGDTAKFYRISFYNVNADIESAQSDYLIGSGYTRSQVGSIIQEIREYIGTSITDTALISTINTAQETICAMNDKWYFLKDKYDITSEIDTARYPLPTDFNVLDKVMVSDGTTTTKLSFTDFDVFQDTYTTTLASSDTTGTYTIDETTNELVIEPASATVGLTFTLYYYKKPTTVVDYTDEIVIPNPAAVIFYVCSKMEAKKKNPEGNTMYWKEYNGQLNLLSNKRIKGLKPFRVNQVQ